MKKLIDKDFIIKSFLSGFFIGLGGMAYIFTENKYIAAFLFCIALYFILILSLILYTGRVGYFYEVGNKEKLRLIFIVLFNIIGAVLFSAISSVIVKQYNKVGLIDKIIEAKTINSVNWAPFIIRGILCGIIIHLAIVGYKYSDNPLFRFLAILFPIMVFITVKAEHSIANTYYYFLYFFLGKFKVKVLYSLLILIITNGIGSTFIQCMLKPVLDKIDEKKKKVIKK